MAESRKRAILSSATLDFGSVAAETTAELTATVQGVRPGMVALANAASAEAGLVVSAYVSDNDEVTVRVANVTAGAIDPASQSFNIAVIA